MALCTYARICPFFTADVGYSPELHDAMKTRFCLEDNTGCARLVAMELVGIESVPDDLLPTDAERAQTLS